MLQIHQKESDNFWNTGSWKGLETFQHKLENGIVKRVRYDDSYPVNIIYPDNLADFKASSTIKSPFMFLRVGY